MLKRAVSRRGAGVAALAVAPLAVAPLAVAPLADDGHERRQHDRVVPRVDAGESLEVGGDRAGAGAGGRLRPGVAHAEAGVPHERRQEGTDVRMPCPGHRHLQPADPTCRRDRLLRHKDAISAEDARHAAERPQRIADVHQEEPAVDEVDRFGEDEILDRLSDSHHLCPTGGGGRLGGGVTGNGIGIDCIDASRLAHQVRQRHGDVTGAGADVSASPASPEAEALERCSERPAIDVVAQAELVHRRDRNGPPGGSAGGRAGAGSSVTRVRVTMMLCDAAQVADGKLYVLGGGWSLVGPDPMPSAVALKIDVDWNEAGSEHHWELFLVDEDGGAVLVETPEGARPLEVRGEFQVERPPTVPAGSPIDVALAVNFGPLPLPPSSRYTWRLTIDGESAPDWVLAFSTRPARDAGATEQ